MVGTERFFFDEKGVPLGQIAIADVREVFGDEPFRGIGNITDPEADQTGMRELSLGEGRTVFEFDVWMDVAGKEKIRRLRLEIGELENATPVEQYDYELDRNGDYYLPGPGRALPLPEQPLPSYEGFLKAMTEGPEPYTPY